MKHLAKCPNPIFISEFILKKNFYLCTCCSLRGSPENRFVLHFCLKQTQNILDEVHDMA